MNKKVVFIILGILAVGFLLISNKPKQTEVSPEAVKKIEEKRSPLSSEEDSFLNLLEKNAVSGGPPKDGIPSIDRPQYTTAEEADKWLLPNDVVFGVDYKGFVAAYPQRILVWHEVANEVIGDERVSITYCPLTGTTVGFKADFAEEVSTTFGVSGKLVNSNLIMYDRASDSYWPQILGKAIRGPGKGISLEEFPIVWTTWQDWKKKYPSTKVLSKETGFIRDYSERGDPYGSYIDKNQGYYTSNDIIFRPINSDSRMSPKTVVVGVRDEKGNALAVLKDKLRREKKVEVSLDGKTIEVTYDEELDAGSAKIKETEEWINSFDAMWFAWAAFYPDTALVQ